MTQSLSKVLSWGIIFSDGACSGNPGPGGWGTIVVVPGLENHVIELGGFEPKTTNNRMELLSVIQGLKVSQDEKHPFRVYTDSTYVIRGITQWIHRWRTTGWVSAEGNDIANVELWKQLSDLVRGRTLEWHYVRGHTGVPGNERVDQIAVEYSRRERPHLYEGPLREYTVSILEIPSETSLPAQKKSSTPSTSKPFSYLSVVNQVPQRHATWKECELRIKGRSGARFRKAMSAEEEAEILKSWGFSSAHLDE